MIRFCCPSCKAVLEHAAPGATVGCPTCGQPLEVPAAVPEEQLPEVILLPEGESRRPPRPRRGGKYCPECGADVHPRDRYCPDCDTRLGRPANTAGRPAGSKHSMVDPGPVQLPLMPM